MLRDVSLLCDLFLLHNVFEYHSYASVLAYPAIENKFFHFVKICPYVLYVLILALLHISRIERWQHFKFIDYKIVKVPFYCETASGNAEKPEFFDIYIRLFKYFFRQLGIRRLPDEVVCLSSLSVLFVFAFSANSAGIFRSAFFASSAGVLEFLDGIKDLSSGKSVIPVLQFISVFLVEPQSAVFYNDGSDAGRSPDQIECQFLLYFMAFSVSVLCHKTAFFTPADYLKELSAV